MNYIIFDLEFNQKHPDNKDIASPDLTFEILQIGAVKLDDNLNTAATFDELIKPTVFSTIHPYVKDLTNITIDMVNPCKTFPYVLDNFLKFIGDDDYTFIVWGTGDLRELFRNLAYHKIPLNSLTRKYIDIQSYASTYFKYPKGNKIGLKNAIELLNVDIEKHFHNAFNDAFYTCEIFKKLYNDRLKRKDYKIPSKKIRNQPKQKLDLDSLFAQFEKIYRRPMTKEEKEIIKLSYMMGKTKQFIKDN